MCEAVKFDCCNNNGVKICTHFQSHNEDWRPSAKYQSVSIFLFQFYYLITLSSQLKIIHKSSTILFSESTKCAKEILGAGFLLIDHLTSERKGKLLCS